MTQKQVSEHTAGPWHIKFGRVIGANGDTVVDLTCAMSGADTEADARLIAAAPEQHDALEDVAAWLRHYIAWCEAHRTIQGHEVMPPQAIVIQAKVEVAIAKARGQAVTQ